MARRRPPRSDTRSKNLQGLRFYRGMRHRLDVPMPPDFSQSRAKVRLSIRYITPNRLRTCLVGLRTGFNYVPKLSGRSREMRCRARISNIHRPRIRRSSARSAITRIESFDEPISHRDFPTRKSVKLGCHFRGFR